MMNEIRGTTALALAAVVLAACGDSGPVDPNIPREDVTGSYRLVELTFDPQGSLPARDIRARLVERGKPDASLTLLADGQLQLLFEDPDSPLLRLVAGSYRTTPTGVTLDFDGGSPFAALLLPQRATFLRRGDRSLLLEGDVATVSRAALVALVPELAQEQLLDPVPGALRVVFAPAP